MEAASVFRAHAAHFVVFGLPVLGLVATVAGQELAARRRQRSTAVGASVAPGAPASDAPVPATAVGVRLAAAGLAIAALIHAAVIREHFGESVLYGLFFSALAVAQMTVAIGIVKRPDRRLLRAVAVSSAWVIVLWLVSRTTGLPIGPEPWKPEAYGVLDVLSSAAELATVAGCLVALGRRPVARRVEVAKSVLPL